MTATGNYAIHGGVSGRERLRVLGRVMAAPTAALLDRVGVHDGHACIDVGCGGGDASLELAWRASPSGSVVGLDLDGVKLQIAREEAARRGVKNLEFRHADFREFAADAAYDVVYARFLLTHLSDPAAAVQSFFRCLRPGGMVAVEDIDFSGMFTHPPSPATQRYIELYCATVRNRGADPNIGPRLPSLLIDAGFDEVGVAVVQPVGLTGEAKLLNPLTMQGITDAVLADGLASQAEIDQLVADLFAFAENPYTLAGLPRVVQAWGRRPASAPST